MMLSGSPMRTSVVIARHIEAAKKLCHNCDTKAVFAAKTDFVDDVPLLILRNLLKAKKCSKSPAYRPVRYFSTTSVELFPGISR
jgi:hypothetical protein